MPAENKDLTRDVILRISPKRNTLIVEEQKPGGAVAFKEISPMELYFALNSVEEYEKVKGHPAIGANILAKHKGVEPLCAGVLHHHERWNGTGYPNHLAGEDIPYAARLIALCDSIDAMLTDRVYRKALGSERAYTEIKRNRGTLYDPAVTEVCLLHWTYITSDAQRVDGTVTAGEVPL